MQKIIVWIFKLLAIMLISLICWDFFIGSPAQNSSNAAGGASTGETTVMTNLSNYTDRGSRFEQLTYGGLTADGKYTGMKYTAATTWLRNSLYNGYLTETFTIDIWEDAKLYSGADKTWKQTTP